MRDVRRRGIQGDGTPEPDGTAGGADPEQEAEVAHGVQGGGGVRHGRGRYDAAGEPQAMVGNEEKKQNPGGWVGFSRDERGVVGSWSTLVQWRSNPTD